MIDPYLIIQHQSLKQTEALVVAHQDIQVFIETEPPSPPSSATVPVPSAPTVPVKQRAA